MTVKSLLKLIGQALIALGFILNICMVLFGLWPSLLYVIMMVVGTAILLVVRNFNSLNPVSLKKLIVLTASVIVGFVLLAVLIFFLAQDSIKRKNTQAECAEISPALSRYKADTGAYPADMNTLIGLNPLRRDWQTDEWGVPYRFITNKNNRGYTLTSAGKDGKFGTLDDIILKG